MFRLSLLLITPTLLPDPNGTSKQRYGGMIRQGKARVNHAVGEGQKQEKARYSFQPQPHTVPLLQSSSSKSRSS